MILSVMLQAVIHTMNVHNKIPPLLILLSSLLGCASPQVVEKTVPIEIVRTSYVPLAESLLVKCEGHPIPLANGVTNAELRYGYLAYKLYSSCLEAHLDAIRALQPK